MNLLQFEDLLPQFRQTFQLQEQNRKAFVVKIQTERKRAAGASAQFKHDLEEQLLMILIYYRLFLSQEFLTLLFKFENKSGISPELKLMRALFEAVLPTPQKAWQKVLPLCQREKPETKARQFDRRVSSGLSGTALYH